MYKNLFLNTDLGVIYLDGNGKILQLNPAAENILGITFAEVNKKCPSFDKWNIANEDGRPLLENEHPVYITLKKGISVKNRIIRIKICKADKEIWLKLGTFPEFKEAETKPYKVLVTFSDITDKIITDRTLTESIAKIRTIYDSINDALLIHPFQEKGFAKFIEVNKEACLRYGYTKEEFLNLTAKDITKKDEVEIHGKEENRNDLLLKKNKVFETVHITKTGQEIPVEISSNVSEINNKLFIVAVVRDISERKIIKEKNKENEETLARVFDVATIGYWKLNIKTGKYTWSDYTKKIIEYDEKNQFPSTYQEHMSLSHPEDINAILTEIENSNKTGEFNIEHRLLLKNKKEKWVRIKSRTILDANGVPDSAVGIIQDITKQKLGEIALKESEIKFKALIEKAPYAIYLTDKNGNMVVTNEIASSQLGYTKEEFGQINLTDIDADFKNLEQVKSVWKELENKNSLRFISNHLKKDGSKLPVEIIISFIKIGDETFVLGFVTDISEKKKVEDQLKLTQFGIDHSQIGIYQIDEEGYITYANEHACNSLGYTKEEILKLSILDIDTQFDKKSWKQNRKKTQAKLVNTFETFHKRNDGSVFPVEVTINYIEFEDKKVSFSFAKDITESKRILEALKNSEARLSTAMKISKLAYWEYDVKKSLFTFNDQFYSIFKTSVDEVGGYKMSAQEFSETFVYPDDRYIVREAIEKALQATDDKTGRQLEHRIVYKNGEIGYISVNLYVILGDDGKVIKTYGANQDITERKKIETELIIAKNLAEENDLLKTSFLNNMSHEIRTPLNVIQGYAGLIGEYSHGSEDLKELTEPIQRSTTQLQKIIEDILDISRIETGQLSVQLENLDLNTIVKESIAEQKLRAKEKNIDISFESPLPTNVANAKTDLIKLKQILNNLIANAIIYTNEGSIKISLIKIDNEIQFCIKDTGIGIDKKFFSTIFERFQRVEMYTTNHYHSSTKGGTGLGLSISKALVELLGGRIWLNSVVGKGTEFYFTIPGNK